MTSLVRGRGMALCYNRAMETTAADVLAANWSDWAQLFLRPSEPGFWLLVDLAAAMGFALLLAGLSLRRRNLLRATRWPVVPFLALMLGAVSPQGMGLAGIDWQATLRLGLPLVAGLLLLLALVRLAVRAEGAGSGDLPNADSGTTAWAILYSGVEQLHWCFQRAALLAIFLALPSATTNAAYWATWMAVLLALPGLLLLPSGWSRLWNLVALAATAILFFYTRNFWLCWLLHAGTMLIAGPALLRSASPTSTRAMRVR
ncbi:MAG: hypothetical protein ACRC1H_14480 [Caldilineaceae bacterium]